MMMRGRYELAGSGNWTDGAECLWERQRKKKERKMNKSEQKQIKTKERKTSNRTTTETSKSSDEKQTVLMSAWRLLRGFFRGFPVSLLRESGG
jgi:hypothetical protein